MSTEMKVGDKVRLARDRRIRYYVRKVYKTPNGVFVEALRHTRKIRERVMFEGQDLETVT